MHYPQCNGVVGRSELEREGRAGASSLYGAPGGGQPPPPPPPPPTGSTEHQDRHGRAEPATDQCRGTRVNAGTTFTVTMTGTGDPDLYVRWNAAPTRRRTPAARTSTAPGETCSLTVPAGATTAYVMVCGYAAGSYDLSVSY